MQQLCCRVTNTPRIHVCTLSALQVGAATAAAASCVRTSITEKLLKPLLPSRQSAVAPHPQSVHLRLPQQHVLPYTAQQQLLGKPAAIAVPVSCRDSASAAPTAGLAWPPAFTCETTLCCRLDYVLWSPPGQLRALLQSIPTQLLLQAATDACTRPVCCCFAACCSKPPLHAQLSTSCHQPPPPWSLKARSLRRVWLRALLAALDGLRKNRFSCAVRRSGRESSGVKPNTA